MPQTRLNAYIVTYPVIVTKAHKHRVTKDVTTDTTTQSQPHTHSNTERLNSTVFCTVSSYHTLTQMLSSHTDTITNTARHNHKTDTQHSYSNTNMGSQLATSPSVAFPCPPRYHTQSHRHADAADRQGCTLSLGSRPPPSTNLGGQNWERKAAHCLRVGLLPDSWAAPGTKGVAQGTCTLGPLIKPWGGG